MLYSLYVAGSLASSVVLVSLLINLVLQCWVLERQLPWSVLYDMQISLHKFNVTTSSVGHFEYLP